MTNDINPAVAGLISHTTSVVALSFRQFVERDRGDKASRADLSAGLPVTG